jgi:hypothetical protein
MRVLILGSGFDSLLAAHAASLTGHDPYIVSETDQQETLRGPQILRSPIPMVPAMARAVRVENIGDPEYFLDKLHNQGGRGAEPEGISPELPTGSMLWDAHATNDWLWDTYGKYVHVKKSGIGCADVLELQKEFGADYMISGIDRDELCGKRNEHSFAASVVVTMDLPEAGEANMYNNLIFSGHPDHAWSIESHLFKKSVRCYGKHKQPPISADRLSGYIIPQGFNCDCHAITMDHVGKLGAWDETRTRHRSFYDTFANLDGRA